MNWIIAKQSETRYVIRRRGEGEVGHIQKSNTDEQWFVVMAGASNLNGLMASLERAIGYVRGVERAVQVYGKETAR